MSASHLGSNMVRLCCVSLKKEGVILALSCKVEFEG